MTEPTARTTESLVGQYWLVEIEADAVVSDAKN
jgi:hypothetical protein